MVVMIKLKYFFIVFLTVCFCTCYSQVKKKPNLYLFFENDTSKKMYKRHFDQGYLKGKHNEFDLYDYFYTSLPKIKYQFASKYKTKALITNGAYVKAIKPKTWDWLKQLKNRLPATYHKDFPYLHIYLVEKQKDNQYKIVEVETFIGDEFP